MSKRLALLGGSVLIALALLEIGARLSYRLAEGEAFPAALERERLAPLAGAEGTQRVDPDRTAEPDAAEPFWVGNKAIHPYLGFVRDHRAEPKTTNRFGFHGVDPLRPVAENEVRVAIVGGSVALQLCREAGDVLHRKLKALPEFAERRVQLVCLALGGYKQPQQLLAVTWFLAEGAHFDVVINLDGFNEVALPIIENVPHGTYSSFPRSWRLYARGALDAAQVDTLVERRIAEEERQRWRWRLGTPPLNRSAFALRTLDAIDARLQLRLAEIEQRFADAIESDAPYQATGPERSYKVREALFDHVAQQWAGASRQLARLCAANHIRYLHFLQPNQHVPGSKPLAPHERKRMQARGPDDPLTTVIPRGYAALQTQGQRLRQQGIAFHDLTNLFQNQPDPSYRDGCCHFNKSGIRSIARHIAAQVGKH